jgi:hypothetical protein
MKKNVAISILTYEMLLELSKKSRKQPDEYLEVMIKENFSKSTK